MAAGRLSERVRRRLVFNAPDVSHASDVFWERSAHPAGGPIGRVLPAKLPAQCIDLSNIDGSIDFWLSLPAFADAARRPTLVAFVWWQGSADVSMTTEQYAGKLRSLIGSARSTHVELPVRIVEITDFPIRASVREAQRQVARDPGVELIPQADLPVDATGHLTPAGNQTLRDRIYRSLGR